MTRLLFCCLVVVFAGSTAIPADKAPARTPKGALQAFNDLIGSWRGTGTPEGTRDKQRGFWTESLTCEWRFKGDDASLKLAFDKSKHFTTGELRYVPANDAYQLTLQLIGNDSLTFTGALKDKVLTLERTDEKTKESQRLVITMLHANRFLYRYEVKPADRPSFTRLYTVGATKEGVPFAVGSAAPECVVSGGLGTIKVSYKGKDYYVCCSGCRDAFKDDPEKYIKEFEERKKEKAKE
jgi:hypothetical protein